MSQTGEAPKSWMQRLLNGVERAGNKVPHPAVLVFVRTGLVVVLSVALAGTSVSYLRMNLDTHRAEQATTGIGFSCWAHTWSTEGNTLADSSASLPTQCQRETLWFPLAELQGQGLGLGLVEFQLVGEALHQALAALEREEVGFIGG
jgi:hypothetical protein